MALKLRLISENPDVFDNFEIIEEQSSLKDQNTLYVKGPYIGCNMKNKNGRWYDIEDTRKDVNRYIQEMVVPGRALGELNHPACNTKNADILTQDGWKSIVDVKQHDIIPTLNMNTGKIELHPIKQKIDQSYNGKMYRLVGRNIDVTVTPNHRFPLIHRNGEKSLVAIEEIYKNRKKYNKSYIPKLGDWYSDIDTIKIPGNKNVNSNYHTNNVEDDLVIPSSLFAKFMGIWLAEGWTITRKYNNSSYTVGISQRKDSVKQFIRELLMDFPIQWSERTDDNNTTTFWVSDIRLFEYLHPIGDCYGKYIPQEIKNLSSEDLEELIYWFNLGDGRFSTTCHENGYIQRNIFSVSKRLIDDLHECLIKSGGCGNITTIITETDYKFADHIIKSENKVPLYQLSVATTKGIYLDDRFLKIEEIEFDDNVYCVTVQNETFYCRENGKAFWSGNSPEVNLERSCHMVVDLKEEDNNYWGKSKILTTPMGMLLRSLINDGVKVGMSTRALGSLEEDASRGNVVKNMHLVAIDAVADPSYPKAFVNGILESKSWVLNKNGDFQELYEDFEKTISHLPKKEVNAFLKEQIIKFINSLG